jgi:hypothetical protein
MLDRVRSQSCSKLPMRRVINLWFHAHAVRVKPRTDRFRMGSSKRLHLPSASEVLTTWLSKVIAEIGRDGKCVSEHR